MDIAIDVKNLNKSYGNHKVLKNISFQVYKGEIFSLLGINGAGKTTALECIEGLREYEGIVDIYGDIGIQLQSSTLSAHIKAIEAIHLFEMWNHTKLDTEVIERLGILEFKDREYEQMSTGQKRRLHLCLALIGNPDILFLDEPTAGLDVEGRIALHNEMKRLKEMGKTIIVSSHDMAEVEELCDRMIILKDGDIVFTGSPYELTDVIQDKYQIHVVFSKDLELSQTNAILLKDKEYIFETSEIVSSLEDIITISKKHNVSIKDIQISRPSFEESFINIVKGDTENESISL
ncbi:MAG: ABC transporter ATP-binding protein [Coprobacillus sp.]